MKIDFKNFHIKLKGLLPAKKKGSRDKKPEVKKIKPDEETRAVQKREQTHLREGTPSEERCPKKKNPFEKIGFDPDYLLAAFTRLIAAVIAVGLVLCAGYRVLTLVSDEVVTTAVTSISESDTCTGRGYILRDETVIYADNTGYADYAVADGERVAKGDVLCRYYSSDMSSVREKLEKLDAEIELLKNAVGTGPDSPGLEESMTAVKESYALLMKYTAEGDYASAAALEDTLRARLARLAHKTGEGTGLTDELLDLQKTRNEEAAKLSNPVSTVTAAQAGYYYHSADGCESVLSTDMLRTFSEDVFREIASAAVPATVPGSAGKLAKSSTWYLAVEFEGFDLQDLKLSSSYTLAFMQGSETEVEMTLKNSVRTETGMIFLFCTDILPEGFDFSRIQDVRMTSAVYSGMRIPVSALHSLDGMTGVYILDGRYVSFRRINIIYSGTGYVIAEPYATAAESAPSVYYVLPYGDRAVIGGDGQMKALARSEELSRKTFANGRGTLSYALTMCGENSGTAVKYGDTYEYYPYLSDSALLITSGSGLYDGKVLN